MMLALVALGYAGLSFAQTPSVTLNWEPNPSNRKTGIRYYPYRAAGECGTFGQEFRRLTESPVDGLTYTDTTVRSGRKYCFYVTATDGKEESRPSPTAEAVIPVAQSR